MSDILPTKPHSDVDTIPKDTLWFLGEAADVAKNIMSWYDYQDWDDVPTPIQDVIRAINTTNDELKGQIACLQEGKIRIIAQKYAMERSKPEFALTDTSDEALVDSEVYAAIALTDRLTWFIKNRTYRTGRASYEVFGRVMDDQTTQQIINFAKQHFYYGGFFQRFYQLSNTYPFNQSGQGLEYVDFNSKYR